MKVLINTPQLLGQRGVGSYYLSLQRFWQHDVIYNYVGGRKWFRRSIRVPGSIVLPYDIMKFIIQVLFIRPDLIVINPSLIENSLKRDLVFLSIAAFFKMKVCVFFRGWNKDYERKIDRKNLADKLNKAVGIIVLADEFKHSLESWGVTVKIYKETTKVDDALILRYQERPKQYSGKNLLFLANVSRKKGIFIALDAIKILKRDYPDIVLNVAGKGEDFIEAVRYAKDCNLDNVNFLGQLSGDDLIAAFHKSDVYLFPSFHGEGMPNSLLEAMAMGLAVITRPAGGIKDFFLDGEMGFMIENITAGEIAKHVISFIQNIDRLKKVGDNNHQYAYCHFSASKVAARLENILSEIVG